MRFVVVPWRPCFRNISRAASRMRSFVVSFFASREGGGVRATFFFAARFGGGVFALIKMSALILLLGQGKMSALIFFQGSGDSGSPRMFSACSRAGNFLAPRLSFD